MYRWLILGLAKDLPKNHVPMFPLWAPIRGPCLSSLGFLSTENDVSSLRGTFSRCSRHFNHLVVNTWIQSIVGSRYSYTRYEEFPNGWKYVGSGSGVCVCCSLMYSSSMHIIRLFLMVS